MAEVRRVSEERGMEKIASSSAGTIRKNQRSTITSGMERKVFTYPAANHDRSGTPERRNTASTVPQRIPTPTATAVISSVRSMPCQRKGRDGGIELQSN